MRISGARLSGGIGMNRRILNPPVDSDCLVGWRLAETAAGDNAVDASGNGFTGVRGAGSPAVRSGGYISDTARDMSIDCGVTGGTTTPWYEYYFKCADDAKLRPANWTLLAWLKIISIPCYSYGSLLCGKGRSAALALWKDHPTRGRGNGTYVYIRCQALVNNYPNELGAISPYHLSLGYHQIVGTFDTDNKIRLYVDGALTHTSSVFAGAMTYTADWFRVGGGWGADTPNPLYIDPVDAWVDEAWFYSSAKPLAWIQARYGL